MARTVFANARNFSHKGSGDKSLCSAPDVCKTPIGNSTPPIPYCIVSQVSDLGGGTSSVKVSGNPTAIASSSHTKCSGDEPGTAKGVASGATKEKSEFTTYSFDVKAEGEGVVRHMDMTTMNKTNTIGMVLGGMTSPSVIQVEDPEAWDIETQDQELKTLLIRLDVSSDDAAETDDEYILSSVDGSYQSSKIVSSDFIDGGEYIDLLYEDIEPNNSYTLEHRPSDESNSYLYFEDVRYSALASLSKKTLNQ